MKYFVSAAIILMTTGASAAPVVYTNEALFLANLAGYTVISESFENNAVWAPSRNSIVMPGSTPSVTSQGIVWSSNYSSNNIATGTVGGSAPDGQFAIYSLPHGMTGDSGLYCDSAEDPNIPLECFQNDGLKIASENGSAIYALGGRVDSNTGIPKITFHLDGIDINADPINNIDNIQREGDVANNWDFIGVIDAAGFNSAEIRELRGKDFQQVLLFADDFSIAVSPASPVPLPATSGLFFAGILGLFAISARKRRRL
jgi:hypothetical protein